MIEREFIKDRIKYVKVKEYVDSTIGKLAGVGTIAIEKTPLGEKITIEAARPGIVIGRVGKTISELTNTLKTKYGLDNPQIDVREATSPRTNAAIVAKKIAADLERFGPAKFKAIGYRAMQDALTAGALGAEIRITGRGVPGARAQSWRFYGGYMKKCGQVAMEGVDFAISRADLHSGSVGIQVAIMPHDVRLPDRIKIRPLAAPAQPATAEQKLEPIAAPETEKNKTSRKKEDGNTKSQ